MYTLLAFTGEQASFDALERDVRGLIVASAQDGYRNLPALVWKRSPNGERTHVDASVGTTAFVRVYCEQLGRDVAEHEEDVGWWAAIDLSGRNDDSLWLMCVVAEAAARGHGAILDDQGYFFGGRVTIRELRQRAFARYYTGSSSRVAVDRGGDSRRR